MFNKNFDITKHFCRFYEDNIILFFNSNFQKINDFIVKQSLDLLSFIMDKLNPKNIQEITAVFEFIMISTMVGFLGNVMITKDKKIKIIKSINAALKSLLNLTDEDFDEKHLFDEE
jgi:hypothetical protein